MKSKAQIAVTDLFIAVFIFMILIIFIVIYLDTYDKRLDESIKYQELETIGFQITDMLVKSRGIPPDWESNISNADAIGLAGYDRILSYNRVNAFFDSNYTELKEKFNIERCNFYIVLTAINGTAIKDIGEPSDGDYSVDINRYVLYQNETTILKFTIWE